MDYDPDYNSLSEKINNSFNHHKEITEMQFTGLTDKNGKEIYEGDIVKLDSWEPKEMQICFIEGAFCLGDNKGEYVGDIHYIQHAGINQCEVIGNVYEGLHSGENTDILTGWNNPTKTQSQKPLKDTMSMKKPNEKLD